MKYVNNSGNPMFVIIKGASILVNQSQEVESAEILKYPGLDPIMPTKKTVEYEEKITIEAPVAKKKKVLTKSKSSEG